MFTVHPNLVLCFPQNCLSKFLQDCVCLPCTCILAVQMWTNRGGENVITFIILSLRKCTLFICKFVCEMSVSEQAHKGNFG